MKKHVNIYRIIICILAFFSLCLVSGCSLFESNEDYDVSDEYFTCLSFERSTLADTNFQTGETSYEYCIRVKSSCDVSLYKYHALVTLFSDDMPIFSGEIDKEEDILADKSFEFDIVVGESVQLATRKIDVSYSGHSHEDPRKIAEKLNVTFVFNNNMPNKTVKVKKGTTVQTPPDPTKANYIFTGWYLDESFYEKYDFSSAVTEDITLYASYDLDAATITNTISKKTMQSIVKIYNKSYNTFLGIETSSFTSLGSGFCFHVQNGHYYILTNCHVAIKDSSYSHQKFTIEDYLGNTYTGYLYNNPTKNIDAIAASYDLACLYFESSSTNVRALSFDYDPKISDDVVSLGSPNGQSNFIAFGKVDAYKVVRLTNANEAESNVKFEVIQHTAWIDHGSSGGPLLNADLQVIGVNYASNDKTHSTTSVSFAIPASRVSDFLRYYVYN